MANIIEVGTGFAYRRLSLGNEEFARTFKFGPRWTKIKIGILLGMNGESNITTNILFGLCAGTANTFNSATADGWLGIHPATNYPSTVTYSYAAGPPKSYSSSSGIKYRTTKIGATVASVAAGAASGWYFANAPDNLSMWVLTFNKSPANNWIEINSAHAASAAQTAEVNSDFRWYDNMEVEQEGSQRYGMSTANVFSAAYNWAGNPELDSVSFVWGSASPTIDIAHIGVVRFQ